LATHSKLFSSPTNPRNIGGQASWTKRPDALDDLRNSCCQQQETLTGFFRQSSLTDSCDVTLLNGVQLYSHRDPGATAANPGNHASAVDLMSNEVQQETLQVEDQNRAVGCVDDCLTIRPAKLPVGQFHGPDDSFTDHARSHEDGFFFHGSLLVFLPNSGSWLGEQKQRRLPERETSLFLHTFSSSTG